MNWSEWSVCQNNMQRVCSHCVTQSELMICLVINYSKHEHEQNMCAQLSRASQKHSCCACCFCFYSLLRPLLVFFSVGWRFEAICASTHYVCDRTLCSNAAFEACKTSKNSFPWSWPGFKSSACRHYYFSIGTTSSSSHNRRVHPEAAELGATRRCQSAWGCTEVYLRINRRPVAYHDCIDALPFLWLQRFHGTRNTRGAQGN